MRTIWKGSIAFGLVTVPVGVVVAQDQGGGLRMNRVSRTSGARVRHRRWDPVEDREVAHDDTVAAYEVAPGHVATVDRATLAALRAGPVAEPPPPPVVAAPGPAPTPAREDAEIPVEVPAWARPPDGPLALDAPDDDDEEPVEAAAVAPPATTAADEPSPAPDVARSAPDPHTIAVEHFVPLADVPAELFDRAYWLAPEREGARPYRLLHAALREDGRAAVARVVLRERERLALVRAADDLLVLHTLYWPEDVREADRRRIAGAVATTPLAREELDLARRLVGHLERDWDATAHHDAARARIRAYLEAQAPGAVPAPPPPAEAPVGDLLAALRASLAAAEGAPGRGERAAGA